MSLQYRYVETGLAMPETWNDMQITKSGNSYYASADFTISNFNRNIAYSFEVKAADKLESATGSAVGIKSLPVFHWSESDFAFEVPVKIQGSPITDFVVEQGTTGIWTYRKWNSGIAECWGKYNFTDITTSGQWAGYYIASIASISFPTNLFAEYPAVNVTPLIGNYPGNIYCDGITNTVRVNLACHNETTVSGDIHISVRGRWK